MEALLSISTKSAPLAAGQSEGKFKITICMADGSQMQTQLLDSTSTVDNPPLKVVFQDVEPGDWIVSATRIDQNGADIAPAASRTFNVAATEAGETQVPCTITFQLQ